MQGLCEKVIELAAKYCHKAINEPKRLYSRLKEDPWYFVSVGTAFVVPTLAAGITAYTMNEYNYPKDTIINAAIWTKNAGFFLVNIPLHLYTHRKKFETIKDLLKETRTIASSNLFGLVANTVIQPIAHGFALDYGIPDPAAVLMTYPPIGAGVTYLKVLYDDFMGAIGLGKKQ